MTFSHETAVNLTQHLVRVSRNIKYVRQHKSIDTVCLHRQGFGQPLDGGLIFKPLLTARLNYAVKNATGVQSLWLTRRVQNYQVIAENIAKHFAQGLSLCNGQGLTQWLAAPGA